MDTPDAGVIELLLRCRFGSDRDWFGRPLSVDAFRVTWGGAFDHGGFFRRWALFSVAVQGDFLESPVLPGPGSVGLFAWNRHNFYYLNGADWHNLELVLAREGRPLEEANPIMLANLFSSAIGNAGPSYHGVIESPHELAANAEPAEWRRIGSTIHSPRLRGNPEAGWELDFHSLFGWMHRKGRLVSHRFYILPYFTILAEGRTLSERFVTKFPDIEY